MLFVFLLKYFEILFALEKIKLHSVDLNLIFVIISRFRGDVSRDPITGSFIASTDLDHELHEAATRGAALHLSSDTSLYQVTALH